MAVNIYEIDPLEIGKKVEKQSVKKTPAKKSQKVPPVPATNAEESAKPKPKPRKRKTSDDTAVEAVSDTTAEPAPKPKKPRKTKLMSEHPVEQTETKPPVATNQKSDDAAAAEKKEQARLKRVAAKEKKLAAQAEAEKEAKKKEAAEKRRVAREAKKKEQQDKPPEEMPAWMKPLVKSIQNRESAVAADAEKPKVRQEVAKAAKEKWQDETTRSLITDEVINHRQRMQNLIFPNRPF